MNNKSVVVLKGCGKEGVMLLEAMEANRRTNRERDYTNMFCQHSVLNERLGQGKYRESDFMP